MLLKGNILRQAACAAFVHLGGGEPCGAG